MNYVPLCIKTDYSLLSSLIKIDDLIVKLTSYGINAAAICDDNLSGAYEFYEKCINANIKPIIGLSLKQPYPVLLYAKNYDGYQNLCKIDSLKNKKELTEEKLFNLLTNLMIIIPFEKRDILETFSKSISYENIFIGYQTKDEYLAIDGNKVFVKSFLSLNKDDEKYLSYLYQIKGEEASFNDVTLLSQTDSINKKTTSYFSLKCNVIIPKRNDLLPIYNTDKGFNADSYLTQLAVFGLKKRLLNVVNEKYAERLKYELSVIKSMGFSNYFLVVWDYVKFAKKNNILVGPGRGSAASSLVSYALGITDIDPIKYDLLFERFLNPQRITMPDIDVDFDAERRQEVIDYVIEKYGKDNVSGIITFSVLAAKQVVRDLGRILKINSFKIDQLVNLFEDKKSLVDLKNKDSIKQLLNSNLDLQKLYDIASKLEGLKRHSSIHAAGIVICNKPLCNYVPIQMSLDGMMLCGYTMNYIENLGLLKMDFLGIKNLSMVDKVIKKINNKISFSSIPLNDEKTFELFSKGELDGVFQFESSGMKKFIMELMPKNIDDLIAAVALFRPGPINNIPSYVARKNGREKVTYIHNDLKDILKPTYGIIVYQEQIMQIASVMAGYSYGEADVLRRAMSKKKEEVLLKEKDKFIKGALKNGYTKNIAMEVYDLILKFANYGFNKAHSVPYAIIGYKIAYLKAHYSLAFMSEILTNYIGLVNKTINGINECKRLGIKIVKPSINTSCYDYVISEGKLEYSLAMIKSVGVLTCKQIVEERNNGTFIDYFDFIKRMCKLDKPVIKNLILAGCLDEFNLTRKTMIENLDEVLNYAELCEDLDDKLVIKPELKHFDEYDKDELINQEMQVFGFYFDNHPASQYNIKNTISLQDIENNFDKYVQIVLYIDKKHDVDTKKKDKMAFLNGSDAYGNIDLVMFPSVYKKYFNMVVPSIYLVNGRVEKRFSKYQLVVSNVNRLDK